MVRLLLAELLRLLLLLQHAWAGLLRLLLLLQHAWEDDAGHFAGHHLYGGSEN